MQCEWKLNHKLLTTIKNAYNERQDKIDKQYFGRNFGDNNFGLAVSPTTNDYTLSTELCLFQLPCNVNKMDVNVNWIIDYDKEIIKDEVKYDIFYSDDAVCNFFCKFKKSIHEIKELSIKIKIKITNVYSNVQRIDELQWSEYNIN